MVLTAVSVVIVLAGIALVTFAVRQFVLSQRDARPAEPAPAEPVQNEWRVKVLEESPAAVEAQSPAPAEDESPVAAEQESPPAAEEESPAETEAESPAEVQAVQEESPAPAAEEPAAATEEAQPQAAAEPAPAAWEAANLVNVEVTTSDGILVEIKNDGPERIMDVILSEVRHPDHPQWSWRPVASGADSTRTWWRIDPGQSVRCQVEFLDEDDVVTPSPTDVGYAVRAYWSDAFGGWWLLSAQRLGAAAPGPGDASVPDELPRLNKAEDHELRQLAWFASMGQLSEESQARFEHLISRDRRNTVRDIRPDPTSKLSDEKAERVEPAGPKLTQCGNCGFETHGAALPGFCPVCAQPVASAPSRY